MQAELDGMDATEDGAMPVEALAEAAAGKEQAVPAF
jgi:hypothetical protein